MRTNPQEPVQATVKQTKKFNVITDIRAFGEPLSYTDEPTDTLSTSELYKVIKSMYHIKRKTGIMNITSIKESISADLWERFGIKLSAHWIGEIVNNKTRRERC